MQIQKNLAIIFTFPIPEDKKDFLTHIPIRFRNTLSKNIKITVLYSGCLNESKLNQANISVIKLGEYSNGTLTKHLHILKLCYLLFRCLKKNKFDLIMNANNHKWMGLIGLVAKRFRTKSIARITGDILPKCKRSPIQKLRYYANLTIEKTSLLRVNYIICLSHQLKEITEARTRIFNKITTLSQGVDLNAFSYEDGEIQEPYQVLYVGRIETQKGVELLLDAISDLNKSDMIFNLNLFGNGSLKTKLEKKYRSSSYIKFYGQIDHNQLPEIYHKNDILALPSLKEGLPNVLLEGMATGTIVLASDVSDNKRLLGNGQWGFILDNISTEEIKNKLITIVEDTNLSSKQKLAREFVENHHSFAAVNDFFKAILKF